MRRRALAALGVVVGTVALAAGPPVPQASMADPWLVKTTRFQFEPQRAPNAPVQLDFPKKDWMMLPSGGSVVLMLASRKGDATILVERSVLREAIEPADMTEAFATVEIDMIRTQQPKATEFLSRVLSTGARRLIAVQYARPGILGNERVRQYSLPVGKQLYQLTCISSAGEFARYDPVFSHIAASLTVTE